ncbi:MAG: cation diffusion facilitator family transporter, partial [Eubacteriales bacterium]|nr:cation diffusion facilitator family transporter [Eubacteriales bacterium]
NQYEKTEAGYNHGKKITVACIFGNLTLSALKFFAGIFGRSQAMISDALHSASDIVTSVVVLVGIKIAKKPRDKEHPYGHGKVEPIAAAIIGVALVFAAVMIIKGITESIIAHSFTTPTFLALSAAVLSIAVKEAMYRVTYAAGKKINSEAIMADAWHHRSDAFSSIGTFIGILGSMIGSWTGIHFLEYLDPIAGAFVACLIFKVAYDILKHAAKGLMDASPDDEKLKDIRKIASGTEGIISVVQIKGRYVGPSLYVDMEIEVSSNITVEAGHDIADKVRQNVIEMVDDVYEVLIHVEPGQTVNIQNAKRCKSVMGMEE